jgi:hypothetical protein
VRAGVGLGVVVAGVAAAMLVRSGGVAPSGTLVIDAVPWATITAIEAESGERQVLPSPASTPLSLSLPAGNYEVIVSGPPPESEERRISVRVEPDGGTIVPTIRFRALSPDEYFGQYLAAPPVPAEPVAALPAPSAPVSAGAAPPAVAPPVPVPGVTP